MRNDNKAENQHYVPKMLLRNFCISGTEKVCVFDKWESRVFTPNIAGIVSERDFNVAKVDDRQINLEPFYTFVESSAKTAIDKLVKHRTLTVLDALDIATINIFVAAQYLRSKHTRETFGELNKAMADHIRRMGHDPNEVEGFKELTAEEIKELSLEMAEYIPEFAEHINQKDWLLYETTEADPFYVADNPVVLRNEKTFGPYGNLGFAVPGIQIYLPLSSTLALAMWCPSILGESYATVGKLQGPLEQQKGLALLGATEAIRQQAAKKQKLLQAQLDTSKELKQALELHRHYETGTPIMQASQNVEFMNYLQVRFAHRYVMCQKDGFELARRIMKEKPEWKIGLMPRI